jgi:hypothetical protein
VVSTPAASWPRARWLLGAVALLAVVLIVAFGAAVSVLESKVAEALGKHSETSAIRVGWSGVVVEGLRIPAPSGWPAADALRAERVTVVPTLRSLVRGDPYRIWSVTLHRPYLSLVRGRSGKLVALPGLRADSKAPDEATGGSRRVSLREVEVEDGVLEIFDSRVSTPPLQIRIEQVEASLREMIVPTLLGRSEFEIEGVVKGVHEDGTVQISGWADIGTRDSSITTRLRSVDLVPLQRYLIRKGEAGVRGGRFDLDLHSEVRDRRVHAPGTLSLADLQLESESGALGTFMGVSRGAVIAALEKKGGRIGLDFTIEGDIDSPEFSLDEALSTRLAYSLAETLGVGLSGLVEGVGTLGQKGGEAAGEAARGVSEMFQDLFDDEPKR